jgi:hypothetical protein
VPDAPPAAIKARRFSIRAGAAPLTGGLGLGRALPAKKLRAFLLSINKLRMPVLAEKRATFAAQERDFLTECKPQLCRFGRSSKVGNGALRRCSDVAPLTPGHASRGDSDDHDVVVVRYLVRSGRGRHSRIFRPRRNDDDRLRDRQTREPHPMDLLRWVAEGSNIFGLMIYCAGMTLILGTLALANYADHRRDEQEQSAKR